MAIKFRYLQHYKDRYGNDWAYVRRNGRKIRIKESIGSPGFARAYSVALHQLNSPPGPIQQPNQKDHTQPGTLGWLAAQYFASPQFKKLDARSQSIRRSVIEGCLREPPNPDSASTLAACPINASIHKMSFRSVCDCIYEKKRRISTASGGERDSIRDRLMGPRSLPLAVPIRPNNFFDGVVVGARQSRNY